jgi:hypothetical protein
MSAARLTNPNHHTTRHADQRGARVGDAADDGTGEAPGRAGRRGSVMVGKVATAA